MRKKRNLQLLLEEQNNTLYRMIRIYCNKHHTHQVPERRSERATGIQAEHLNDNLPDAGDASINARRVTLCDTCMQLYDYALERIYTCQLKEQSYFCSECPVHCYKIEMREQIKTIMRYSGPRMLWHDPRMAVRHLIATHRARKKQRMSSNQKSHQASARQTSGADMHPSLPLTHTENQIPPASLHEVQQPGRSHQ